MPTNAEQMNKVLDSLTSLEKEIGYMKIKQSDMLNKQDGYIKKQDEIIGLLENNDSIGKVGYIQKVDQLDDRLGKVESDVKLTIGKVSFAVMALTVIGGLVLKAYSAFK